MKVCIKSFNILESVYHIQVFVEFFRVFYRALELDMV